MASLLSWLGQRAKAVEAQLNPFDKGATYNTVMQNRAPTPNTGSLFQRDVAQPFRRDVVQPAQQAIHNPLQIPVIGNFLTADKSILHAPENLIKVAAADLTHNPVARNNAIKPLLPAIHTGQQIASAVPELVTSIRPTQKTYTPGSRIEKALFGSGPIQNVQKRVANTYSSRPDQPAWRRAALAAAVGAGNVAQIAPVVGGAAKGIGLADKALSKAIPATQDLNVSRVGLSTKKVTGPTDNKALQTLINPAMAKQEGKNVASVVKAPEGAPADAIPQVTHTVRNQKAMEQAAAKMVAQDPVRARETFSNGDLLGKTPDSHEKLGTALVDNAIKQGNIDEARAIMGELVPSRTQAAQGLRAANYGSAVNPATIVRYALKIADKKGVPLPKERVAALQDMSKTVAKMKPGPEKAQAIREMRQYAENPSNWEKVGKQVGAVLSIPRAVLASTDISGGGRQGGWLGSRKPALWAKAEAVGAKAAFSTKYHDQEAIKLKNLTDKNGVKLAPAYRRSGLSVQVIEGKGEEVFGNTSLAEGTVAKKLGAGHVIAGSNRAYGLTLSHLRAHAFKEMIDDAGGVDAAMKNWNTKQFRAAGRAIDTLTGRGRGGKYFEKVAPVLGQTLFSARLAKSRVDFFNPAFYVSVWSNPAARRLVLEANGSFASLITVVLASAAAAGAAVELDPRSSDFAKAKFGNTRYDIAGGLQQLGVLLAREATGKSKSSATGKVSSLTSGDYGGQNRLSVIARTVENKLAPVLGEAIKQVQGKDIAGNKLTGTARLKSIGSLGVPLSIQDTAGTVMDRGPLKGVPMAIPGYLGAGVQTYGSKTPGKPAPQQVAAKQNLQTEDEFKASNPKGNTLMQVVDKNGNKRYAYTVDGADGVKTADTLQKARNAIAENTLKQSGESYKVVGETVYRKSYTGDVTAQPKIKFDYEVNSATLTSQKNAGDFSGYLKTADAQLKNIQKQLSDPSTDPLDALKLQNEATSLQKNINKYTGYGGFTKPKAARTAKTRKASIPSFKSTTSVKAPKAPSIKVRKPPTFKAPKTRKLSVSHLPSNYLAKKLV